jgi:hypothetical protein
MYTHTHTHTHICIYSFFFEGNEFWTQGLVLARRVLSPLITPPAFKDEMGFSCVFLSPAEYLST